MSRLTKLVSYSILLLGCATSLTAGDVCCQTGYSEYSWCSSYCCNRLDSFSFDYNYCCSDYSDSVSYNSAVDSCDLWWPSHIWIAVVIGLGGLGTFICIVVLVCCCIKGLICKSTSPGRVVTQNTQNPNMFVMSNTVTQQGPNAQGQCTVQMQPLVYNRGFEADYTQQAGKGPVQPPPYIR